MRTHLRSADYSVAPCTIDEAMPLVVRYHYTGGASKTATVLHGLYGSGGRLVGVAWWIPPTKHAANAAYPENWRRVLALHRLVVEPGQPTNAASFLIGRSIRLIKAEGKWEYLLTYADIGEGHTGAIYKATNWEYLGETAPEAQWVTPDGRHVSRKAGGKTRTKQQMEDLGYTMIGRRSKHRFGRKP